MSSSELVTGHLPDAWQQMIKHACGIAQLEAENGVWTVSGNYADLLGAAAMQVVADRTGLSVIPVGQTSYHAGSSFLPAAALGIEAGTGETTEIGSTAKRRKPGPKGNAQTPPGDSNARQ